MDLIEISRSRLQRPKLNVEHPVAIYGAGSFGKKLARILRENKFQVDCFIDRNAKPDMQIDNLPVFSLSQYKGNKNIQVVVGIFNRDVNPKDLKHEIQKFGFGSVFDLTDVIYTDASLKIKSFWLDADFDYIACQEQIDIARDYFCDEISRDLFDQILKYRISGDVQSHPMGRGLEQQYLGLDIKGWLERPHLSLVDCGAFDGDTIRSFVKQKISIQSAICLEPDLANFKKLSECTRNYSNIEFINFPCGSWSETTELQFNSDAGEGSRISQDCTQRVSVVKLDDIIKNKPIDLLKLDVEGAEFETLLGATEIISKYRPQLAVAVYHRPQDLWDLPKLIKKINPDYRFYLRQYGQYTFDTILYAIHGKH